MFQKSEAITKKILGLDVYRDKFVGDAMRRGINSSTTFQIVKCMQQVAHLTESTIFISLLQPAPETFYLFDAIVLLSKVQIVYQGPREHIVEFFESCGFKCPERNGTADFLQEVTSTKSNTG
ncbi:hypothetical protein Tco_1424422 [Tanacetum coccineum]